MTISVSFRKAAIAFSLICVALAGAVLPAAAEEKKSFRLAWSIYAGYMPWLYADTSGIMDKWAGKYGIEIEIVQFNDYIESLNQYTAGAFDAVTGTTMDALTIPAAGGVDSTALILGDYTNGNDAIFIKGADKTMKDLAGKQVYLVEYSVSHYMLWRALGLNGMSEDAITTANIADADFVAAFSTSGVEAVVAWNPATSRINQMSDVSSVFDSSQLPGEIQDILIANSETVKDNPAFAKAVTGAWYEIMALMQKDDEAGIEARTIMASGAGTDLADYDSQVATTYFYYDPAEAAAFYRSPQMDEIVDLVTTSSFGHGLLGNGAENKGHVGVELPGGEVIGDAKNVKLRFDDTYMQMAADGAL